MAWLPDGEKSSKIYLFVLTQLTNVTDGHTQTQTPHADIGRAYASHRAAKILPFVLIPPYRYMSDKNEIVNRNVK